jgi:putative tryptophan/tyrosine transport system ATP-binding protein
MLKLHHITKLYAADKRPALDNICLNLEHGEFCVVIGANGSGKSSLIKTISGEVTPDKGKIVLNQTDITSYAIHQRANAISSVSQDPAKGTIAEMTLLENLSLSLHKTKKASLNMVKHDAPLLTQKVGALNVGLERYMNKPIGTLSGGQRQIIALLMATLFTPRVLLLDEHCSALDPKIHRQVMTLTNEIIHQQKLTTLMITHHLSDAIEYGNRLIMLNQGKIVLDLNAKQKKALTIPKLLQYFHDQTPHAHLIKEGAFA